MSLNVYQNKLGLFQNIQEESFGKHHKKKEEMLFIPLPGEFHTNPICLPGHSAYLGLSIPWLYHVA